MASQAFQALQVPEARQARQARRVRQAVQAAQALRVLAELSPAHPVEVTRPLLAAAVAGAQPVLELAARKSATLLLRVPASASAPAPAPVPASARDYGGSLAMVLKVYDGAHPGQGESADRAGREACALARLRQAGVLAPRLVASGERALLRLYVEGPVARDVHWNPDLARRLAEWVYQCHEALAVEEARSWLVGDMNLGNFVLDVASGRLCGIDMGDTRVGDRLDDVGEGCMRIVCHRPGFTADRWECAVAFATRYGQLAGSVESVLSQVPARASASFRQMAVWRDDPFMAEVAEAFPFLWGEALLSCGLGLNNWSIRPIDDEEGTEGEA